MSIRFKMDYYRSQLTKKFINSLVYFKKVLSLTREIIKRNKIDKKKSIFTKQVLAEKTITFNYLSN